MIKYLTVDTFRHIHIDSTNNVGTVGEKNATTLFFDIPDELKEYPKRELIFNLGDDSFIFQMNGNTFDIPLEITTDTDLRLQLVLKDENDNVKWITEICELELFNSLNASGENAIDALKKEWTAKAQRPLTILINKMSEFFIGGDSNE